MTYAPVAKYRGAVRPASVMIKDVARPFCDLKMLIANMVN